MRILYKIKTHMGGKQPCFHGIFLVNTRINTYNE